MAEVMTSLPALAKSPVDEIINSETESPKQSPRSRSERKTKQALMKCGLKPVEGVSTGNKVILRKYLLKFFLSLDEN